MTKRFGFTLAEVLITLGIIGVVAAMTIPTLMNQTGQAEFKTGFKKMISVLNQAVTMNVALDNTDFSATTGTLTTDTTSIYSLFNNRMNIIKTGTGGDLAGTASTGAAANYTLFFNDGMAISWPIATAQGTQATPVKVLVDVNGSKKPNKLSNCNTASAATKEATTETCSPATLIVGDQFSVKMYDQTVIPNGNAARYVMYQ